MTLRATTGVGKWGPETRDDLASPTGFGDGSPGILHHSDGDRLRDLRSVRRWAAWALPLSPSTGASLWAMGCRQAGGRRCQHRLEHAQERLIPERLMHDPHTQL